MVTAQTLTTFIVCTPHTYYSSLWKQNILAVQNKSKKKVGFINYHQFLNFTLMVIFYGMQKFTYFIILCCPP